MMLDAHRVKVIAVLDAARDLLSNPARWTQIELARDENEDDVDPQSNEAVCWCLQGALQRVARGSVVSVLALEELGETVLETSRRTRLPRTPAFMRTARAAVTFNDRAEHGEVLTLIDETIERLKKEGP